MITLCHSTVQPGGVIEKMLLCAGGSPRGAPFGNSLQKRGNHAEEDRCRRGDIPDSHSVAIVCSHEGRPLYTVSPGRYTVHDTEPQVNSEPLDRYKDAVKDFIATI